MKTLFQRATLLGIGFVMASLFSGCALTKDHVSLSYVPQANAPKYVGASAVGVRVAVIDNRAIKDKVSAKKNAYGMEMAAILSNEDVADTLKKAIEAELANRGFRINSGGVAVVAELNKFYNDFKTGFFSGSTAAEVTMNVQIKRADGSIGYAKLISGTGGLEHIQLMLGSNAKVALDAALKDAVAKLCNDRTFITALLRGGR